MVPNLNIRLSDVETYLTYRAFKYKGNFKTNEDAFKAMLSKAVPGYVPSPEIMPENHTPSALKTLKKVNLKFSRNPGTPGAK